jgi:hypothetical protein
VDDQHLLVRFDLSDAHAKANAIRLILVAAFVVTSVNEFILTSCRSYDDRQGDGVI